LISACRYPSTPKSAKTGASCNVSTREKLAGVWPPFGLTIKTERLELKIPEDKDLLILMKQARHIQPSDEPHFQKAWMYWPTPLMERELLRRYWKSLAEFAPAKWRLKFAVYLVGTPIGVQDIWAEEFATNRAVTTGSWLNIDYQGQGYGTEMRRAVLDLAFNYLGAQEARTDFMEGNVKSSGVSRKLGYIETRVEPTTTDNVTVIKHYLRLDKESWFKTTRPEVAIKGFEACLEMLGLR